MLIVTLFNQTMVNLRLLVINGSEIAGGWLGLVLLKVNADGDILWTNVVYKDSIPNRTIRITNKCLTEVSGGGYLILANE